MHTTKGQHRSSSAHRSVFRFAAPFYAACLFVLIALLQGCTETPSTPTIPREAIVALVGEAPVLREHFSRMQAARFNEYQRRNPTTVLSSEQLQRMQEATLTLLIHRELLYRLALHRGYNLTPTERDRRAAELRRSMGSDEAYRGAVAKWPSEDMMLDDVLFKDALVQGFLRKEVTERVQLTEPELRELYEAKKSIPEQVRVRHIVKLLTPDTPPAEVEALRGQVQAMRTQVLAGAEFAEIARQYSDCPSAPEGGDVGFFAYADMVPEFSAQAFDLNLGAVSEVFQTKFGFHILTPLERRPAREATFDELREELSREAHTQRGERMTTALLEEAGRLFPVAVIEPSLKRVEEAFRDSLRMPNMQSTPSPVMPIGRE